MSFKFFVCICFPGFQCFYKNEILPTCRSYDDFRHGNSDNFDARQIAVTAETAPLDTRPIASASFPLIFLYSSNTCYTKFGFIN